MPTVVVTGSQGFIGGYICRDLLARGYRVVGIDNYSKYGRIERDYDSHPLFDLYVLDCKRDVFKDVLLEIKPDYIVAGAAMIGGIAYFHKYAYDLLATNERIVANTVDAAIELHKLGVLKRLVMMSSSMVYEGADDHSDNVDSLLAPYAANCHEVGESPWPTREGQESVFPPPHSSYGFQKLSCEYFVRAAHEQYGLNYSIVRPFNCVGLGEEPSEHDSVEVGSDTMKLSHVLPDLVSKCVRGLSPLPILGDGSQVRCYTHGKDIARGVHLCMTHENALNEDFNISSSKSMSVLELLNRVKTIVGHDAPLKNLPPYAHDVQKRIPCVEKAKSFLDFEADIDVDVAIQEVYDYLRGAK